VEGWAVGWVRRRGARGWFGFDDDDLLVVLAETTNMVDL
jgi:hypothetical protein